MNMVDSMTFITTNTTSRTLVVLSIATPLASRLRPPQMALKIPPAELMRKRHTILSYVALRHVSWLPLERFLS